MVDAAEHAISFAETSFVYRNSLLKHQSHLPMHAIFYRATLFCRCISYGSVSVRLFIFVRHTPEFYQYKLLAYKDN